MSETIAVVIICIGLLFDLFGCIGLLRLPDIYNRLQAATKCVTLGTCLILIGVAIYTWFTPISIKALICAAFVLVTSPVAAHAISRGSHISGVKLWEGSVVDKLLEKEEAEK